MTRIKSQMGTQHCPEFDRRFFLRGSEDKEVPTNSLFVVLLRPFSFRHVSRTETSKPHRLCRSDLFNGDD